MQPKAIWVGCFALLSTFVHAAVSPLPQRLYVGRRAPEFQPFLKTNCAKVGTPTPERFQPLAVKDFDVVLLDWPQGGSAREERLGAAPLGKRENWSKPTVLLGSAGRNLEMGGYRRYIDPLAKKHGVPTKDLRGSSRAERL